MKEERTFFLVEKWKYSFHLQWWGVSLDSKFDQIANLSSLCATNYWTMRRKSWRSRFCFIRLNVLTLITQQLRHGTVRGAFCPDGRWEYKATFLRVIRPIDWMFLRWCMVMCVSTNRMDRSKRNSFYNDVVVSCVLRQIGFELLLWGAFDGWSLLKRPK